MTDNFKFRVHLPERYCTPKARVVEIKTRGILCQSRDIKDAKERYLDIFGSDEVENEN